VAQALLPVFLVFLRSRNLCPGKETKTQSPRSSAPDIKKTAMATTFADTVFREASTVNSMLKFEPSAALSRPTVASAIILFNVGGPRSSTLPFPPAAPSR